MRNGFSLVELSIVLVILGLLVGGILAGQSLIHASALRKVTTQITQYRTANFAFRDKYFALAGDMPNAVRFWGAQDGGLTDGHDAACVALIAAATDMRTCNGDGNGLIGSNLDGTPTNQTQEQFRYWQHLANAGMLEGKYAGVGHTIAYDATPGYNTPVGPLANSGYSLYYKIAITDNTNNQWWENSPAFHVIYFGAERVGNTHGPLLRPEDTWNIDQKLDDGRPGYGIVQSFKASYPVTPDCTTSDNAADALYNLSNDGRLCAFAIKL